MLSLYDLLVALGHADNGFLLENRSRIYMGIFFQSFLAILFAIRFFVLWRINDRRVWFSQGLWLVGLASIYFYNVATTGRFDLSQTPNCIDCFYYDSFRYSSVGFTLLFLAYLVVSPFKQVAFALYSLVLANRETGGLANV